MYVVVARSSDFLCSFESILVALSLVLHDALHGVALDPTLMTPVHVDLSVDRARRRPVSVENAFDRVPTPVFVYPFESVELKNWSYQKLGPFFLSAFAVPHLRTPYIYACRWNLDIR
jgi:hypothetical protein